MKMFNGLSVEIVWVKGVLTGICFDTEFCEYDRVIKDHVLFCVFLVAVKISWW